MSNEEEIRHYVMTAVDEARKYGLEGEVLTFAFLDLCKDKARVKQAIDYGFYEWIK